MAKYDYLSLIQRVLNRIDDENVDTIDETIEAEQVGMFVNEICDEIASEFPWYHLRTKTQLEVTATAHVMKLPTTVADIFWIFYDDDEVEYKEPKEFTELLLNRDTTLSTVDSNGAINNTDPTYWTTYDDEYIYFDSYNGSLAANETSCWMLVMPSDLVTATQYPDFPDRFHPVILDGATAMAFYTLKRDNQSGMLWDSKYRKGLNRLKRLAMRAHPGQSTYSGNYGRRGVSRLINSRRVVEST